MRVRWHLSKHWHKPFNDPYFDELSHLQMLFYAGMIGQDKREEAEEWRDRLEYIARFIDNESVEKIKRARAQYEETVSDENRRGGTQAQFSDFLEQQFGRGLGSEAEIDHIRIHEE